MTTILATVWVAQPKAPTCPSDVAAAAMRSQRIEFMVDGSYLGCSERHMPGLD